MSIDQTNPIPITDGHPNLTTTEDRFAWLVSVQKITQIFSKRTKYDFNPLKLLAKQHKLVNMLRSSPFYLAAMVNKKYHEICITPPEAGFMYSEAQIQPQAIDAWKAHLKEIQIELGQKPIQEAIEELLKTLQPELREDNLDKKSVHALTNPNVNDRVHNQRLLIAIRKRNPLNLPQEIINRWKDFRGVEPALMRAFEYLAKEQELCNLLELRLVLDKKPNLEQVDAKDLVYFSDTQDVINPKLASFKGLKNQKVFSLKIEKHLKKYALQTIRSGAATRDPITLSQEPPSVAIFRGCAGGDCSSLLSFPYPNDPHERVFFIYDKDRELKGYVSATEVMIKGGPALYIITMNGSRVGAADAEMILEGLEAQKEQLGVKHIALPEPKKIDDLINFPAPKAIYHKYTQDQPLVSITYKDQEVRRAIERFESSYNEKPYDHMGSNRRGVIFKPRTSNKKPGLEVEVRQTVPTIKPQDLNQISSAEILELLIPLHRTGKDREVKQMLKIEKVAKKVSLKAFKTFLEQLDSADLNLDTSAWKKSLQDSLEELEVDKNFLKIKHPEFLYPALLDRNDAFSKENIESTARAMVADMRSNDLTPKGFEFNAFSTEIWERLNETTTFQKFNSLLVAQLRDKNATTRAAAARTFGNLKPADVAIHQALAVLLKDPHADVRHAAAWALGEIAPTDGAIHQALVELLKDPDEEVRLVAMWSLGDTAPTDVAIHQALAVFLKDPDDEVRRAASWALGEIAPTDSAIHQALRKLLEDSHEDVRYAAMRALEKIKQSMA